jgi:hypothetical protein
VSGLDRLSIVIPVGSGDLAWRPLVASLRDLLPGVELVVSSVDPIETSGPVVAVSGPAGRAAQLNRGAAAATGEWLWFLHADSALSANAVPALQDFLGGPPRRIAYFRLRFAGDGPFLVRLNAVGANVRSRWLGLPFGDQGLVVAKALWLELGRFDESFGRGEDLEFVVRARRRGIPLVELPAALITSARRYRDQGWLRTTLLHAWATAEQARRAYRTRSPGSSEETLSRDPQ